MTQRHALLRASILCLACALATTPRALAQSAPPATAPSATPSSARVPPHLGPTRLLERIPAGDAFVRDGTLFILATDGASVTARPLARGTTRWTTPLPGPIRGAVLMTELAPSRLLVHAGEDLFVLDRATGHIVARQHVIANTPGNRAFLHRTRDACGLRNSCSFQPIACDDGRPLGARIGADRNREIHFADDDGAGSGCTSFNVRIIGRAGNVVIYGTNGVGTTAGAAADLVARSLATGSDVYRRALPSGPAYRDELSGVDAAGALCWFVDDAHALQAFDCATGRARWNAALARAPTGITAAVSLGAGRSGVFVSMDDHWTVFDGARGSVVHQGTHAIGTRSFPVGALRDEPVLGLRGPFALRWIDGATGRVAGEQRVATGEHVRVPAGGTLLIASDDRSSEPSGVTIPPSAMAAAFRVERRPGNSPAHVRERFDDRVVHTMTHDGWWLGETRDGGRAIVAIYTAGDRGPGAVLLLAAPIVLSTP